MTPKYRFTIFTPTYNRAHTLHRVYESICAQTLQKINGRWIFEWIIVDDGSSDETKAVVATWQSKSDFPITYHYQENRGKITAIIEGLQYAAGDFFLIADSDDAFYPNTLKSFYEQWCTLSPIQQKECGSIGVLCEDQHGQRTGSDYPITGQLIPTKETVFGWADIGLGETWAALKSDMLRSCFTLPDDAKTLNYIPESFFWVKVALAANRSSLYLNRVLRIYYRDEGGSLSTNIRTVYADGFAYESLYALNHYPYLLFSYPKIYMRHLLKFAIFTMYRQEKFSTALKQIRPLRAKLLFLLLYLPAKVIKPYYLKESHA